MSYFDKITLQGQDIAITDAQARHIDDKVIADFDDGNNKVNIVVTDATTLNITNEKSSAYTNSTSEASADIIMQPDLLKFQDRGWFALNSDDITSLELSKNTALISTKTADYIDEPKYKSSSRLAVYSLSSPGTIEGRENYVALGCYTTTEQSNKTPTYGFYADNNSVGYYENGILKSFAGETPEPLLDTTIYLPSTNIQSELKKSVAFDTHSTLSYGSVVEFHLQSQDSEEEGSASIKLISTTGTTISSIVSVTGNHYIDGHLIMLRNTATARYEVSGWYSLDGNWHNIWETVESAAAVEFMGQIAGPGQTDSYITVTKAKIDHE